MADQWFGQWAGGTAGQWWGGSEAPPVILPADSGGGGRKKKPVKHHGRKYVWVVDPVKGAPREFKTPQAALKAVGQSAAASVTFAGVEVLPGLEKLAQQPKMTATQLSKELQAIEAQARRLAAERDDEEVLILLLH
jgi:hypothetical protein